MRNLGTPFTFVSIIENIFYLIITKTIFILIKILSQNSIKYELLAAAATTVSGHEEEAPHAARTLRPLQFEGRFHPLLQRDQ